MSVQTIEINKIAYVDRKDSTAQLIQNIKQVVGQTAVVESQKTIDARNYELSNRNGANAYIIPTEKEKVYLNFIPQKIYVSDKTYNSMLLPKFEFFVEEIVLPDEPFRLADGMFYRCATATPKAKEDYQYYIMQGGVANAIPNYKSLEVMLAERNLTMLSVRVLEKKQCDEIPVAGSVLPDSSASWTKELSDVTSIEALKKMNDSAKEAGAMIDGAKAEVKQQVDAVKAQAAADKAAAEAAKAEAEAAKAQAAADKAQADAAKAEADAAKAEAEQKQAELDLQLQNGGKT